MRLTVFLIILGIFSVSAKSNAQNVTFHAKNMSLTDLFTVIKKQTGYVFFFRSEDLQGANKVNVRLENMPLTKALDQSLANQPFSYEIQGRTIFITKNSGTISKAGRKMVQERTISGTVKRDDGGTLSNVSILVKGTNLGVITDDRGRYEIIIKGNATLIFSIIGFKSKEETTKDRSRIDVILEEENTSLDEVVVVGYNQVERQHLASSIAELDMNRAKSRPVTKLEEVFSGTIPGLTVLQGHNLPGTGPSAMQIRGVSTLQAASPLVIVDGMEQSLSDLDPNQIKSISVLKDAASASMYGSRGANGVIIIETERGATGQFKVDLHSWQAYFNPIDLPNFVGAADYMLLNNEARTMQGQTPIFTDEAIADAQQGLSSNVDWVDEIVQRRANTHNTSASISGGGGVGSFNLMLGYMKENGQNQIEGTEKFSARFNTNINIADKFVLLADFYAHRLQVDRLLRNDDGHGLYQVAWRMNPTQDVFYDSELPDHYMLHDGLNPLAFINHGGNKNYLHDRSTINLRPRYYITKDLHLNGNVSYMINKSANKFKRETYKLFDGNGKPVETWANSVGAEQGVSESQITARVTLNYEKGLRKDQDKLYLVAGSEIMNHTYTDYREISKSSFFGKLNYSFDNRYLLEATVRSDGSSKFAPGSRWGFFPSGALAWNAHNESFMSGLTDRGIINNLKFRFSYGLIGNENVDPYLWQEIVNTWGWMMRVPNPSFTWEKQRQSNIGVDLAVFNNKLSLTAEYYHKFSYDLIYGAFPVPPLTGSYYLESAINIGEVENKGWELSASWNDKIGNVSYAVGGMLFDNKNKVLKAGYSATDTLIFKDNNDKVWYNGIAIDNYYGYQSNGYFQNQEEVNATTAKLPNTLPGDIKYIDRDGNGVINDKDKVDLGDPFPHLNYSLTLDLTYKNWDFNMLGQGVGRRTGRLNGLEGYPVLVDDGTNNSLGAPRQEYMDNRWTPQTPNSRFPRVWTGASSNTVLSDVWLSNAAFFRIKTLQIGYGIPNVSKNIRNLRIYLNAQDAITFTKWEGLEPERNGGNGSYPRMASFSLGIKATIL